MEKHFSKVCIDWLVSSEAKNLALDSTDEYIEYPYPPEVGTAKGNMLKTSHNISAYKSHHYYKSENIGEWFNLGIISGEFESDSLMIGTAFGGTSIHKEHYPQKEVAYNSHTSIFRHAKQYKFEPMHETTSPLTVDTISLPISSLNLIIGEENTNKLLTSFDIINSPNVVEQNIPIRISKILSMAVSPHLKGSMKKLYCQVKILEYLCELVEYIEVKGGNLKPERKEILAAHEIYDHLHQCDDDIPTLVELASNAGVPARLLSSAFKNEFGLSINRFIMSKRLEQAHNALQETTTPQKVLAHRLGFSHVNYFITEFKRQFGYTPGSLRKIK